MSGQDFFASSNGQSLYTALQQELNGGSKYAQSLSSDINSRWTDIDHKLASRDLAGRVSVPDGVELNQACELPRSNTQAFKPGPLFESRNPGSPNSTEHAAAQINPDKQAKMKI